MSNRTDKALFNRKVLNQASVQFVFPLDLDQKHQIVLKWVELLESGTLYQVKEVTEVYNEYALPIQTRAIEAQKLERQLSDLINQAYGLTPEEIDLMWKTAPPRMLIVNPFLE